MELASMIAGEPFSDQPMSVCPVIGSFLRAYNDSIDDKRRQDLYAYAAKVVDSRGSAQLCRARERRLEEWCNGVQEPRRWTRFLLPKWARELGQVHEANALGARAVHAIRRHNDLTHAQVLRLVDELLELGRTQSEVEVLLLPRPIASSDPSPPPASAILH
jgi:hypothetical protein